jgi:hypothetical protein
VITKGHARNVAADLKRGEIPPWAEDLVRKRTEDFGKDYMTAQCLPLGPGYLIKGRQTGTAARGAILRFDDWSA